MMMMTTLAEMISASTRKSFLLLDSLFSLSFLALDEVRSSDITGARVCLSMMMSRMCLSVVHQASRGTSFFYQ